MRFMRMIRICGYAHRDAHINLDAHQPHTGAKNTTFPHLIPPSIYGVMYVLELDLAVESASHQYEWGNELSNHQVWGFSPVWIGIWVLRFPAWLNDILHSVHLCGFSPLWMSMCRIMWLRNSCTCCICLDSLQCVFWRDISWATVPVGKLHCNALVELMGHGNWEKHCWSKMCWYIVNSLGEERRENVGGIV